MKTIKNALVLLMVMILLGGVPDLQAQGRGRGHEHGKSNPGHGYSKENNYGKGHGREFYNSNDREFTSDGNRGRGNDHDYDHNRGRGEQYVDRGHHDTWNHNDVSGERYRYQHHDSHYRYITYSHHRHVHPSWAPAYGYRYNTRYIYYQDYNVYYDCHRDVFVTWTGRNWMISTRIPDVMFRIDFRNVRMRGVDYWDDDFDFYLQRRRPAFVNISASW